MKVNHSYSLSIKTILFVTNICALYATDAPDVQPSKKNKTELVDFPTRELATKTDIHTPQASNAIKFFSNQTSEHLLNEICDDVQGFVKDLENCVNDTSQAGNAAVKHNIKKLSHDDILESIYLINERNIIKLRLNIKEGKTDALKEYLKKAFENIDRYNKNEGRLAD